MFPAVPYVDTNAKVTDFLPFCTIGISMYQKMLSWNLTPSLRTKLQRWQTFSFFALLELVCTKKVPYPIHYSLLIYPKLILLWSVPDGLTDWQRKFFTPCSLSSFFSTERTGPYPQAQLYWAGRTVGWMANWTRERQKAKLALHVIRMQKRDSSFCKLIGQSPSTELHWVGLRKGKWWGTAMVPAYFKCL